MLRVVIDVNCLLISPLRRKRKTKREAVGLFLKIL